jgi:hypothetical protein
MPTAGPFRFAASPGGSNAVDSTQFVYEDPLALAAKLEVYRRPSAESVLVYDIPSARLITDLEGENRFGFVLDGVSLRVYDLGPSRLFANRFVGPMRQAERFFSVFPDSKVTDGDACALIVQLANGMPLGIVLERCLRPSCNYLATVGDIGGVSQGAALNVELLFHCESSRHRSSAPVRASESDVAVTAQG